MKPSVQPRPRLDLPITKLEICMEVLTIPPVLMNFVLLAVFWNALPHVVATHFDAAGNANGFSPRETLWWIAGFGMFIYLSMSIVSRFPHTLNYVWAITEANAKKQYLLARKFLAILKLESVVLIFFGLWNCIQVSIGAAKVADSTDLFTLLGMILFTCAVYMFGAYSLR
jgi:hypothetical protein